MHFTIFVFPDALMPVGVCVFFVCMCVFVYVCVNVYACVCVCMREREYVCIHSVLNSG